ncbi:MAG: hypothetical protein R2941_24820 [Desulfobacterales bacterium]
MKKQLSAEKALEKEFYREYHAYRERSFISFPRSAWERLRDALRPV